MRLSSGTLNKLQSEFKQVCGELDSTNKKLSDTESAWKRMKAESENKIAMLSQEIERLNDLIKSA